jgi:tRNA pseudouridine(38-40) synthase
MKSAISSECSVCGESFPSKMKLMKHLESVHGYELNSSCRKPDKVVILFGWISQCSEDVEDIALGAHRNDPQIEDALFKAVAEVENNGVPMGEGGIEYRIPGYTRSSFGSQRIFGLMGLDPSNHGLCDVMLVPSRKRWAHSESEWIDQMNCHLPQHIRVHHRFVLPSDVTNEFNAETSCTQVRFECLLPLDVVMPPELAVQPDTPIVRKRHAKPRGTHSAAEVAQNEVAQNEYTKQFNNEQLEMDMEFPAETEDGQARIHYFRKLKLLCKQLAGKLSFHNFAAGGACPEDANTRRKLDRIYHKDILSMPSGLDNTQRRNWVTFSLSGDSFIHGQVRKLMGLVVAVQRGLLPAEYMEVALLNKLDEVVEIPSLPGFLCYIAECRFPFVEGKYQGSLVLDPRRAGKVPVTVGSSDTSRIDAFNLSIHKHIGHIHESQLPLSNGSDSVRDDHAKWFVHFENECKRICCDYEALKALKLRSPTGLSANLDQICLAEADEQLRAPAVYRKVLRLLQQADCSGQWPPSTTLRQKVIAGTSLPENGGTGGSFSVGVMPKPFPEPKGNKLFPGEYVPVFHIFFISFAAFCRIDAGLFRIGDAVVSKPIAFVNYCHKQARSVLASSR